MSGNCKDVSQGAGELVSFKILPNSALKIVETVSESTSLCDSDL
jgi:hypothetical protein